MKIEDRKYVNLSVIGLLLASTLPFYSSLFPVEIRFGILGFIFGWLGAVWLLRFLIVREKIAESKKRSEKVFGEIDKNNTIQKK